MSNEGSSGGAIKQIGDQIYRTFTQKTVDFVSTYPWSCVTVLSLIVAYIGYVCSKTINSTNASRVISVKNSVRSLSVAVSPPVPSDDSFGTDELLGITNPDTHEDVRVKLLRSVRVLGDIFEDSDLLAMAPSVEFVELKPDEVLSKSGDPDDLLYVVQEGKLMISCTDSRTSATVLLRTVEKGDSICSLLAVLENFNTLNPKTSVTITATTNSLVAKFPLSAMITSVKKDTQQMLRLAQLIMMWIHRVLFLALFNYLGLRHDVFITSKLKPELVLDQERRINPFGGRSSITSSGPGPTLPPVTESSDKVELLTADADFREALKKLVWIFQLDNAALLERKLKYIRVPADTVIVQPNEPDTPLLLVASGCLRAWTKKPDDDTDETMIEVFEVNKGEMLGGLALLSGEPMLFQIETKVITKVIAIHRPDFYEILPQNPLLVYGIAQTEICRLHKFIRQIDSGLVWAHVLSGQAIYRKDDDANCLFIVVAGRLRSILTLENGGQRISDYCRGDLVGLVEISVNRKRQTTVFAMRDSEVVIVPVSLLHVIRGGHPGVVSRLVKYLSSNIVLNMDQAEQNSVAEGLAPNSARPETLSTIAVVPSDNASPLSGFAAELEIAFNSICKTLRLASEDVRKNIGSRALQPVGAARLSAWLSQKEDEYRIVLYQSDATLTPWTLRCLRQADCVLILGYGDEDPDFNEVGRFLLGTADKLRGRKDLVLLHKLSGPDVSRTRNWIDAHPWISLHHHIAVPDRMFHKKLARVSHSAVLRPRARSRAATMLDFPHTADKHSDFSRLARILTGTAVGLVLGGGGARGFAHIGIIESLLEEDIPIDMIGGVSMGAFVSALWALYRDLPEVRRRCKIWAQSMGNPWNVLREITYPYMALFSGRLYNQFVRTGVGDAQIEQLWIPYFCASVDITDVTYRVHVRGDLWRYARASMTVVGYFPPICDPEDGHLLVDGGYMNNVPADVMRQRGAGIILAVDVGGEATRQIYHFGDDFNGWTTLKQRFWPWGEPLKVPDITEIQSRLAYVRSISILAALKQCRWCNYIRPPIATFQTLEFHAYDEIVDIGYYCGKHTFAPRGPLRVKLVEMRRQLLTTSFGLFIAHRRPQPVLGQYLTDLASYAKVQTSDGADSEDKRRERSGALTDTARDSNLRESDPSDLIDLPGRNSSDVIGLRPSRSFWDDVQTSETSARAATHAIPMRLSRMNPESFLSVPKKAL